MPNEVKLELDRNYGYAATVRGKRRALLLLRVDDWRRPFRNAGRWLFNTVRSDLELTITIPFRLERGRTPHMFDETVTLAVRTSGVPFCVSGLSTGLGGLLHDAGRLLLNNEVDPVPLGLTADVTEQYWKLLVECAERLGYTFDIDQRPAVERFLVELSSRWRPARKRA